MTEDNITRFIILCDSAHFDASNKLNIQGMFDIIRAEGFPAIGKNMSIAIRFNLEKGSYREYTKILKDNWEVKTTETPIEKKEAGRHNIIHNFSNLIFPKQGDYKIEVYLNDNVVGHDKFSVVKI